MVYFWQKQSGHGKRSRAKSVFSPLISAATTAAETALAPVMTAKSEKMASHELTLSEINAFETLTTTTTTTSSSSTTTTTTGGGTDVHNSLGSVSGSGGGEREGNNNNTNNTNNNNNINNNNTNNNDNNSNFREGLSSPSCRASSGVVTSKIQSLVLDKLAEYARRKQENSRRRVAERELDSLNLKIDKFLSKMDDGDSCCQGKLRQEEECVVCLAAPATMKTFPCGHRVVCRKCLIKTMQVAISQRCLPLRCVICRNRILSLQHSQDPEKDSGVCFAYESSNKNHSNNAANTGSHSYSTKIIRSFTTPAISTSTPSKALLSSPSSPISQQSFVSDHHQGHISSFQAPSTSQGHTSSGPSHQYHHVIPVQFHPSPLPNSMPQNKSGSKTVKRLLGAR